MADAQFFATELERDGMAAIKRGGLLLASAQTLRSMPGVNAPTVEMRQYLAGLGFCVIAADALAYVEHFVSNADAPEDDCLMRHATGASEHDKALLAMQEALKATAAARNKA